MEEFYVLMNKNVPILKCRLGYQGFLAEIQEVYHSEALPVCIRSHKGEVNGEQLGRWWTSRSIPASRIGLREALERLNMESSLELMEKCYGLSLSDQYWMNPEGKLNWSEINFFENDFSEDMGKFLCGEKVDAAFTLMSPDNTSDGWLQKKWKIIDGERYLFKGGSMPYLQEPINEVIATKLMERLHGCEYIPYEVIYQEQKPFSVCPNFINPNTEFVPALHVFRSMDKDSNVDNYSHLLHCAKRFEIGDVEGFLNKMLAVDYILSNTDRHFGNFGFIRNVETYRFEGTAPIFDTGSSLSYNVLDKEIVPGKERMAKPFADTHERQLRYISSFDDIDIGDLKDFPEQVREMFDDYKRPYSEMRISAICKCLDQNIKSLDNYAARFRQEDFQFIRKENGRSQMCDSVTTKKLEVELLKNGFMPTETVMKKKKKVLQGVGSEITLREIRDMYWDLDSVSETLRDTIYQLGEELKEQEVLMQIEEGLFVEL